MIPLLPDGNFHFFLYNYFIFCFFFWVLPCEPRTSWWLGDLLFLLILNASLLKISPNYTAFPIGALNIHTKSLIFVGFKNTFMVIICFSPFIWNHSVFQFDSTKLALQCLDKVNLIVLCFFLLTITFKLLVFWLNFLNWFSFLALSLSFLVSRKHQSHRIGNTALECALPGLWCS